VLPVVCFSVCVMCVFCVVLRLSVVCAYYVLLVYGCDVCTCMTYLDAICRRLTRAHGS